MSIAAAVALALPAAWAQDLAGSGGEGAVVDTGSSSGSQWGSRCCQMRIHFSYAVRSARIDELLKTL